MIRETGKNVASTSAGRRVCALVLLTVGWLACSAEAEPPARPMPLVQADEDLAGYLTRARGMAQADDIEALRVLQALIDRTDGGFIDAGDGRYVALRIRANEVLAELGPKWLATYRTLYDGRAAALYEKARHTGRADLLRSVAERFLHTSHGAKAREQLGAECFDRARFVQAARYWQRVRQLKTSEADEPALLAKIALAHHLAGDADRARAAAETLKHRFGDAEGHIGGKTQKLAAFVERALAAPAPAAAGRVGGSMDWPGLGGVPDGLAVMADCDARLSTGWFHPARQDPKADEPTTLVAARTMTDLNRSSSNAYSAQLVGGHVHVAPGRSGRSDKKVVLPPMVQPVIVDEKVIYRTDAGLVACDVLTGEKLWTTANHAPLERATGGSEGGYYYGYEGVTDQGLYLLTAGEGRIYVRYGFAGSGTSRRHRLVPPGRGGRAQANTAALAAFEADTGRLIWRTGNGRGDDEVIRGGKQVSAPTVCDGRLYVVALYVQTYHMVCLDAATGETRWQAPICQPPVRHGDHGAIASHFLERVSPPAVAEGLVYALPNVGVLVAMEAETGRPVWAFDYRNADAGAARHGEFLIGPAGADGQLRRINPIVVSHGRVVCLPIDSESLVAVSAAEGKPVALHGASRQRQSDLSAIDGERILLSGPGLAVLSIADGKQLFFAKKVEGVRGRPAVTAGKVLAAGEGKIFHLDLKTYGLGKTEVADEQALLGNLVSAGDALIAANTAGLCAYIGFDTARAKLDERIAQAPAPQQAELILRRARLAFRAESFDLVRRDLRAARTLAVRFDDTGADREVDAWTYRLHVAMGDRAKNPQQMAQRFAKAMKLAQTDEQKAQMTLRLAKVHERAGEPEEAVATAVEICRTFPEVEVEDLPVGAAAVEAVKAFPRMTGSQFAKQYVDELIRRHGRAVYAPHDAQAAAALQQARADGDPAAMDTLGQRWPNSEWVDDAAYAAAEIYYLRAREKTGEQADELFGKMTARLSELAAMPDSPYQTPSLAALAAVYARAGRAIHARAIIMRLRDVPPDVPFKFADIEGDLAEIVAALRQGKLPAKGN